MSSRISNEGEEEVIWKKNNGNHASRTMSIFAKQRFQKEKKEKWGLKMYLKKL